MTRQVGNGRLSPLLTPIGGIAIPLINKTGAPSIKGTLIDTEASIDKAVTIEDADGVDAMGVIYQDGVPDGEPVLVVITGVAEVLIEDATAATRGYWCRTSITAAGRADITNAAPPGGGLPEHDIHFKEVGHALESKSSGTDVLAKIILHFN